jgi:hypothetical protein
MSAPKKEPMRAEKAATTAPFFIVRLRPFRIDPTADDARFSLADHHPAGDLVTRPFGEAIQHRSTSMRVSLITRHDRWPEMKLDAREFPRQVRQFTEP